MGFASAAARSCLWWGVCGVCAWGGPSTYDAGRQVHSTWQAKDGPVVRPAWSAGAGRVRSACLRHPCPVTGMPPMTCPYHGLAAVGMYCSQVPGAPCAEHMPCPGTCGAATRCARARTRPAAAGARCPAGLARACGVRRPSLPHQIPEAPAWQRARQAGSPLMCSAAECGTRIIRGKKVTQKAVKSTPPVGTLDQAPLCMGRRCTCSCRAPPPCSNSYQNTRQRRRPRKQTP